MRIAHITEAWQGGIATYVNTLMGHQAARGHEIALIYSENETRRDFDRAFYKSRKIQTLSYTSSRNPAKFLSIGQRIHGLLKGFAPDIVHLHSTFAGVYGRLVRGGYPVVYCPHGWSFVQEAGTLKKAVYTNVEKILARRCEAIINISDHEYTAALRHGVRAPLNAVILSGVNDTAAPGTPANVNINPAYINIGYIGRLDYKKGFDIAARAFSGLSRRDVHLHVIGAPNRDGQADPNLKAPNIHYLGWVNNTEIDSYIRLFDAVILPSRQEGFGLAAVEAMRNARPAIVSDAGGLPELVRNNINGHVFSLEKAETSLPALLHRLDKDKLKYMGENGRRIYESNFTGERLAEEIIALYNKVLYTRKTAA